MLYILIHGLKLKQNLFTFHSNEHSTKAKCDGLIAILAYNTGFLATVQVYKVFVHNGQNIFKIDVTVVVEPF